MEIVEGAEHITIAVKRGDLTKPLDRGEKEHGYDLEKQNRNEPFLNLIGPDFDFHQTEKEKPLEKDKGSGKRKQRVPKAKTCAKDQAMPGIPFDPRKGYKKGEKNKG